MANAARTLTQYSKDELAKALTDIERFTLATRSLVKDPEKVTAIPEPTDWTEQDYARYLSAAPKFERCDISMAAGHALQFWKWYAGTESINKKKSLFNLSWCV